MKRRPPGRARNVLPTAEDLNDQSIDGPEAERNFLGRSLAEAEALFAENSLRYLDDLYSMPARGYHYYFPAAVAYLLSPASTDDPIAVSSFLGSLALRIDRPDELLPTSVPPLLLALSAIQADWDRWFPTDDPETTPWKMIQKTEKWHAETRATLFNVIERLEAICSKKKRRSKSARDRRS